MTKKKPGTEDIDWLEINDKAAQVKKRYDDWPDEHDFNAFDIVRYPFLRPQKPALGSAKREDALDKAEAQFETNLHHWEAQLLEATPKAVVGLSSEQLRQIAALVSDSVQFIRRHREAKHALDAQVKIAKEGESRVGTVKTKLKKAIQALEDLRKCAASLDWQYGFEKLFLTAELCQLKLASAYRESGVEELFDPKSPSYVKESTYDALRKLHPVAKYMVCLYFLFIVYPKNWTGN